MTRGSNVNENAERHGTAVVVKQVNLDEDLAAYDQLPEALRTLLDSLPEKTSAVEFQQVWSQLDHNTDRAVSLIATELEKVYPQWKRPLSTPPKSGRFSQGSKARRLGSRRTRS